MTDSEKKTS
ncbi:hypothetical protein RDI58_017722 [Solanum bulbocastanum]|uniref:Uncharacterized protein n=1 Tax=Solanum bulbocastanum TaxID=147425 RepID=A0AAN8TGL1_SOLBU